MKQKIAFLGTGLMGLPMCGHLLDAGYAVNVWNRTSSKAQILADKGAVLCADPCKAVAGADVVVIMLSSGPVVDDVLFSDQPGSGATASQLSSGATVVVMSSIPVETAQAQAEKLQQVGVHYIDAPVSGGEKGAIESTLTIMAGGAADVLEKVHEVLQVFGRVTRIGPVGSGQLAKLANQTIVGISIGAVSEAMLLAQAGGADLAAVREALSGGFADSTILRQHGERMINRQFEPGGAARTQLKDLTTSRKLGESLGLDLPILSLLETLYEDMCAHGMGELDHSALYLEIEQRKPDSSGD